MKNAYAAALVAVLLGLADAKVAFTNSAFDVVKGQAFTLTWSGGSGPYTVELKSGSSTNLQTVSTLTSSSTAQSLTWTPDSTLTSGTYAFEIIDTSDDVTNYSSQFTYSGASAAASATTVSASSSGSSSASSSSKTATSSVTSASSSGSSTASSSSASKTDSSSVSSSVTSSASASTTDSSTMTTHTSSASKTTSSAATTSAASLPNTNGARGIVAPFMGVVAVAALAL